MINNTYSAASFRKPVSQGPKKFNTSGVKTNLKLKDVVVDDRWIKIQFETSDGSQYAEKTIWLNSYQPFVDEMDKTKFESRIMNALVNLMDLVATVEEVDSINASSLSGYAVKFKELMLSNKDKATFNVGVVFDKKGEYTEIPEGYGIIEKYVEGVNPKIDLAYYASRLTKSVNTQAAVAASAPSPKRDDMPF